MNTRKLTYLAPSHGRLASDILQPTNTAAARGAPRHDQRILSGYRRVLGVCEQHVEHECVQSERRCVESREWRR